MATTKDSIIADAFTLSEDDRLEVIWQLSQSVKGPNGVTAAWDDEIDRRLKPVADGSARFVPWETVRTQILGASEGTRG